MLWLVGLKNTVCYNQASVTPGKKDPAAHTDTITPQHNLGTDKKWEEKALTPLAKELNPEQGEGGKSPPEQRSESAPSEAPSKAQQQDSPGFKCPLVTQMSLWKNACCWPLPAACEVNGKAPTEGSASTGARGEEAFKIFPIIHTARRQSYLHRWFEQSIIMLWAHLFSGELRWLLEHKHNLPSHNKVNTLHFNWMKSFTQ